MRSDFSSENRIFNNIAQHTIEKDTKVTMNCSKSGFYCVLVGGKKTPNIQKKARTPAVPFI